MVAGTQDTGEREQLKIPNVWPTHASGCYKRYRPHEDLLLCPSKQP